MKNEPIKIVNPMSGLSVAGAGIAQAAICANTVWQEMVNSQPLYSKLQDIMDTNHINELFKSYMQKLIDDGRMFRLSEIKKMDILDTTGFLPALDNGYGMPSFGRANEQEKEAIRKLGWYAGIPCFEKGALKLNRFRYIVFEMQEINPETKSAKISIRDYLKPEGQIWQMGVGAVVTIGATDIKDETGEEHYYRADIESRENFEDLYTSYSAKDMHWTDSDYEIWQNTIVKHAQVMNVQLQQTTKLDQCDSLVNMFVLIVSRCNAMLEMNKPSRPIKKAAAQSADTKKKISYEKGAEPERKTRCVGALRVQSKNVPRKPCFETVVTYKVAKWTVRGHVRHYKSGKDVYIKPGTRTRKALEGSDKVTATTIRFKKKKGDQP